jgi:hypothetical protein
LAIIASRAAPPVFPFACESLAIKSAARLAKARGKAGANPTKLMDRVIDDLDQGASAGSG